MKLKKWEWLIILGIVAVLVKTGIGAMVVDAVTNPGSVVPHVEIK